MTYFGNPTIVIMLTVTANSSTRLTKISPGLSNITSVENNIYLIKGNQITAVIKMGELDLKSLMHFLFNCCS